MSIATAATEALSFAVMTGAVFVGFALLVAWLRTVADLVWFIDLQKWRSAVVTIAAASLIVFIVLVLSGERPVPLALLSVLLLVVVPFAVFYLVNLWCYFSDRRRERQKGRTAASTTGAEVPPCEGTPWRKILQSHVFDAAAARQRAAYIAPPYVAMTAAELRVEEGEG